MIKRYLFNNYQFVFKQYLKLRRRIEKSISTGSFGKYSHVRRVEMYMKLKGLGEKLISLQPSFKPAVAAGILALATYITPAYSQGPFSKQTGNANPFNGINAGNYAVVAWEDLDNDGDWDAVIGSNVYYSGNSGYIRYYKNTGSKTTPAFTEQIGANNPFAGITIEGYAAPAFADLDDDGDKDMILGEDYSSNGTVRYFENTGSVSSSVFTEKTGTNNPMSGYPELGDELIPFLVDIDNDGDQDLFVGEENDTQIFYFQNTGTKSAPVFTQRTGSYNPLNDISSQIPDGFRAMPTFADIDRDGDIDAIIGYNEYNYASYNYEGKLAYFKNTGTKTAPVFTLQTGSNDPFDGMILGYASTPSFVNLDNDSDLDLLAGDESGTVVYYKNDQNPTAVNLKDISKDLSIYPNPAASSVKVSIQNDVTGECQISLKSAAGVELSKETVSKSSFDLEHSIDVESLTPGVYLIQITSESNSGVVKFIKK